MSSMALINLQPHIWLTQGEKREANATSVLLKKTAKGQLAASMEKKYLQKPVLGNMG